MFYRDGAMLVECYIHFTCLTFVLNCWIFASNPNLKPKFLPGND